MVKEKSKLQETPQFRIHDNNAIESDSFKKIFYISLIYISFILGGIFEEKIYKTKYPIDNSPQKTIQFHDAKISLFLISIISSLLSYAGILINQRNLPKDIKSPIDTADKVILGSYYIISRYTAESSLQYLDFIVKVIGKSCKSVAIILITALYNVPIIGQIFQKLINQTEKNRKQSTTKMDFIKVIITTASVLLFNYSPSGDSSSYSDKSNLLGYLLLIVSLLSDSLLSLKEKIINQEVHSNPKLTEYRKIMNWIYMFIFSIMTTLTTTLVIIYSILFKDFAKSLSVYMTSSSLVIDIISYSIITSIGQAILFIFLEKYGPLTLSLITSVRKVLTVALSIIIFRKPISIIQGVSLILAGTVIMIEVLDKQTTKKSKEH